MSSGNTNLPFMVYPKVQIAIIVAIKKIWSNKFLLLKLFSIPYILSIIQDIISMKFFNLQGYNTSNFFSQLLPKKSAIIEQHQSILQYAVDVHSTTSSPTYILFAILSILLFLIILYLKAAMFIAIIRNDLLNKPANIKDIFKPTKAIWKFLGVGVLFFIATIVIFGLSLYLSMNSQPVVWISILDQILSIFIVIVLFYFLLKFAFTWLFIALNYKHSLSLSFKLIKDQLFFKLLFGSILFIVVSFIIAFIEQNIFVLMEYANFIPSSLLFVLQFVIVAIFNLFMLYFVSTYLYFLMLYYKLACAIIST